MKTYRAHADVSILNDYLEVPGLGFLPVNAFVLHSAQPVVIDTGLGFITDAVAVIDTSRRTGRRVLVEAGGVRPRRGRNLKGRWLSFAEREEIALARAAGESMRSIARRLGVAGRNGRVAGLQARPTNTEPPSIVWPSCSGLASLPWLAVMSEPSVTLRARNANGPKSSSAPIA
jgi:hypothetical protein